MKIKNSNFIRMVGLLIFVYILYKIDWEKSKILLIQTNMLLIIAAIMLNIPLFWLKSFRWKILLNWQNHMISSRDAFLYYISGTYLGIITPGRVGDFAKVFYLKQAHIATISQGFSSVFIDRLHDLYLLLLLGTWGCIIYMPNQFFQIGGWAGLIVLLIFPPLLFAVNPLKKYGIGFFDKLIHSRLFSLTKLNTKDFRENFKKLIDARLWQTLGLTAAASALLFSQNYLILLATHIPITYFEIIPIMALVELVSLLPISIAGLGTREAALIFILNPRGIGTEMVVLYSIGVFLISFFGGALIGVMAWWKKPITLNCLDILKNKKMDDIPNE